MNYKIHQDPSTWSQNRHHRVKKSRVRTGGREERTSNGGAGAGPYLLRLRGRRHEVGGRGVRHGRGAQHLGGRRQRARRGARRVEHVHVRLLYVCNRRPREPRRGGTTHATALDAVLTSALLHLEDVGGGRRRLLRCGGGAAGEGRLRTRLASISNEVKTTNGVRDALYVLRGCVVLQLGRGRRRLRRLVLRPVHIAPALLLLVPHDLRTRISFHTTPVDSQQSRRAECNAPIVRCLAISDRLYR